VSLAVVGGKLGWTARDFPEAFYGSPVSAKGSGLRRGPARASPAFRGLGRVQSPSASRPPVNPLVCTPASTETPVPALRSDAVLASAGSDERRRRRALPSNAKGGRRCRNSLRLKESGRRRSPCREGPALPPRTVDSFTIMKGKARKWATPIDQLSVLIRPYRFASCHFFQEA